MLRAVVCCVLRATVLLLYTYVCPPLFNICLIYPSICKYDFRCTSIPCPALPSSIQGLRLGCSGSSVSELDSVFLLPVLVPASSYSAPASEISNRVSALTEILKL